jgi:hypothetical protein
MFYVPRASVLPAHRDSLQRDIGRHPDGFVPIAGTLKALAGFSSCGDLQISMGATRQWELQLTK